MSLKIYSNWNLNLKTNQIKAVRKIPRLDYLVLENKNFEIKKRKN